eukprot:CAMPEP_0171129262 /NCGR_PEP_ID=MMETSP0766_2-20121228/118584_1 /TAXON_ID=439317 /ORGANISM="Gambierdiscus australes, Strain CAWD 149" /LENGTH=92 /DNA_ID=CAMNT_0011592455 /DNA_START=962 /DNA_END=1240 /DNA_ORIENTATION=-
MFSLQTVEAPEPTRYGGVDDLAVTGHLLTARALVLYGTAVAVRASHGETLQLFRQGAEVARATTCLMSSDGEHSEAAEQYSNHEESGGEHEQ